MSNFNPYCPCTDHIDLFNYQEQEIKKVFLERLQKHLLSVAICLCLKTKNTCSFVLLELKSLELLNFWNLQC